MTTLTGLSRINGPEPRWDTLSFEFTNKDLMRTDPLPVTYVVVYDKDAPAFFEPLNPLPGTINQPISIKATDNDDGLTNIEISDPLVGTTTLTPPGPEGTVDTEIAGTYNFGGVQGKRSHDYGDRSSR